MIFMMNFIKVHMMAVNYENAGKLDDPAAAKQFTERERKFAEPLRNRVHFFDFCNYMFFVACSWTGMSHEYLHFDDYINNKKGYANIPRDKLVGAALTRFGQMWLCLGAKVFLSMFFPIGYMLTSEWAALNPFLRLSYLVISINNNVFACFVGFASMESSIIACG